MKGINITFQACKCYNQHLLETGEICEICMGVVTRSVLVEGPKWAQYVIAYLWLGIEEETPLWFPDDLESDPFDELYFEELESYYEDREYAT